MNRVLIFVILSLPVIIISRKSLFRTTSHGYYRFFSWECILWLLATSFKYWFDNPFVIRQLLSWLFLFISTYLLISGVLLLKKIGKPNKERDKEGLYQFEQTSRLVDTGIFKYIRHPLYASLLFLTWGIFLKNITVETLIVSCLSSVFLFLTAKADEKECVQYFGKQYIDYIRRTKRFVPFII
jgi:protein-S-isoprenylcysteine O-methyltransferase Ste14